MFVFSNVSRARRAIFCAAMAGLGLVSATPAVAQDEEEKPPLLTRELEKTSFGEKMSDAGLRVDGYIQASYTHSFGSPPGNVLDGRGLDFEEDELNLNGIGVNFRREIEATSDKTDFGFALDFLYGTDARFTKSNGLLDHNGFVFDGEGDGPENQFDITQANVTVALPVGNGLLLTIGKFITPIGYEYVDPRKNSLFSHGYLFNFGAPFSQTGITARYQFADNLAVTGGITRGWDQSLEDDNEGVDFLGVVEYSPDEQWNLSLAVSTGQQTPDSDGWRTVLDFLVGYEATEQWVFGGEALYGIEADVPGAGDTYSQWYGVAVYETYKVCPGFSLNGRQEWFSDADLVRGVGTEHVFSVTLGATFEPLIKNELGDALKIRPEIRWDYAPDDDVFDGGTQNDQLTFAIDAVFAF